MARDVAQRQLDQNGQRIVNLGTPEAPGDATRTDNQSIPKANAGTGSPGQSFLAAPADHVHPAAPASPGGVAITIADGTMQSHRGAGEVLWQGALDFSDLPGERVAVTLSALMNVVSGTGKLQLNIQGDVDQTDGTHVATIETTSGETEPRTARGEFAKPSGVALVKLIAVATGEGAQVQIQGKTVTFRSA